MTVSYFQVQLETTSPLLTIPISKATRFLALSVRWRPNNRPRWSSARTPSKCEDPARLSRQGSARSH